MNIGCKKAVVVKAAAFLFGLLCVLKTQLFKIKFLLYNYYNVIICLIHSDIYKGKYI